MMLESLTCYQFKPFFISFKKQSKPLLVNVLEHLRRAVMEATGFAFMSHRQLK